MKKLELSPLVQIFQPFLYSMLSQVVLCIPLLLITGVWPKYKTKTYKR